MKKVLIIDDEIHASDHLKRIVEKSGFDVSTAASGEDGIKIYKDIRPDFVFLDIMLPGIDGEYVFNHIRQYDPGAGIYFITGRENIISREQAKSLGAKGFLTKPIFLEDIQKLVANMKDEQEQTFFCGGD